MDEIENTVLEFFRTKRNVLAQTEAEELACNYLEEKLIDSMGLVEMVLEFEEKFGVAFKSSDMQSPEFRTTGGLIGTIEKLSYKKFSS